VRERGIVDAATIGSSMDEMARSGTATLDMYCAEEA
jgi:hypothetical protein